MKYLFKSDTVPSMENNILQLSEPLQNALLSLGIHEFSTVQKECIPPACHGKDVFAQAPTGAGKTYAYLIPILERMELQGKGKHYPQALILSPTRELSLQIAANVRDLLKNIEGIRTAVLTGGVDMNDQVRSFSKGADIVIGTPSRICDHLRRHTLKTKKITMAVCDEADVMLSMGFEADVHTIMDSLPTHQTLFFSATYNPEVEGLIKQYLHDPFQCHIEEETFLAQETTYQCILTDTHAKMDLLKKILPSCSGQVLIFCNTRKTSDYVCAILQERHFSCETIHSEMDSKVRKKIMQRFRDHDLPILIATDVASRGIDVPSVSTVISYDLPDHMDDLVHRFGRTARAGHAGEAYLFLTIQQKTKLADIQSLFPAIIVKEKEAVR